MKLKIRNSDQKPVINLIWFQKFNNNSETVIVQRTQQNCYLGILNSKSIVLRTTLQVFTVGLTFVMVRTGLDFHTKLHSNKLVFSQHAVTSTLNCYLWIGSQLKLFKNALKRKVFLFSGKNEKLKSTDALMCFRKTKK